MGDSQWPDWFFDLDPREIKLAHVPPTSIPMPLISPAFLVTGKPAALPEFRTPLEHQPPRQCANRVRIEKRRTVDCWSLIETSTETRNDKGPNQHAQVLGSLHSHSGMLQRISGFNQPWRTGHPADSESTRKPVTRKPGAPFPTSPGVGKKSRHKNRRGNEGES